MSNRKQRRANKSTGKPQDSLTQGLFDQALQLHRAARLEEAERLYRTILASQPGHADSLHMLGLISFKTGAYDTAADQIEQAIKLKKGDPFCHFNLGNCYRIKGRTDDAVREYRRASTIKPDYVEAHFNLGNLYRDQGKINDAILCYQKALTHRPDYGEALFNLGGCLQKQGRFKEAEAQYLAALEINPLWPEALYNTGILYLKMDWPRNEAKGRQYLERAVGLDAQHENAWINLIRSYERAGDYETEEKILDRALRHIPTNFELAVIAETIRRRNEVSGQDSGAIFERANRLFEEDRDAITSAVMVDIAKLLDSSGDSSCAFKWFARANAEKKKIFTEHGISRESFPRVIDGYRKALTAASQWPPAPSLPTEMPCPVFLVGFPRSGTTLLDQIFASHPDIEVAEESPALQIVAHEIIATDGRSEWEMLSRLDHNVINAARERYMTEMRDFGCRLRRDKIFIDKNPFDMVYVPLILRLFPDARFLLALRHPCDAVLSNLMQHFVSNDAMVHMTDLHDAARIYDRAFTAWTEAVTALNPQVHAIRYENVVSDMRMEITAALRFLGLQWSDDLLKFHETAKERNITTPSRLQVTQEIYTGARGRWYKYRELMEDVPELLRPWATRFGYQID